VLNESVTATLSEDGHNVTVATEVRPVSMHFTTPEASEPFDVVITDLGMPYVDGRQVIDSVRATARVFHYFAHGLGTAAGRQRAAAARGSAAQQTAAPARIAHGAQ